MSSLSPILGVFRPIGGNLRFIRVADREQHLLRVVKVAAALAMIFEDARLDDRIDGTALLAHAAENAFGEIDVVSSRPARTIGALLRLDRDCECGTDRF